MELCGPWSWPTRWLTLLRHQEWLCCDNKGRFLEDIQDRKFRKVARNIGNGASKGRELYRRHSEVSVLSLRREKRAGVLLSPVGEGFSSLPMGSRQLSPYRPETVRM